MENENKVIESKHFVEGIAFLLREAFEGSPEGQPSAFLERGVGFFSTLEDVTAEQSSADFFGTTISAQTEHAKFYLDRLCEFIHGRTAAVNWEDSWLIETVNSSEWDALRMTLQKSYENTLRCIAEVDDWDESKIGMAIGLVAHTAYHLGAIRQITKTTIKIADASVHG